jgi:co-chaperonin GroES (HSP10)
MEDKTGSLRVLGARIALKKITREIKTHSGIFLPQLKSSSNTIWGEVIGVGDCLGPVSVGDQVAFKANMASQTFIGEEKGRQDEIFVIRESDAEICVAKQNGSL